MKLSHCCPRRAYLSATMMSISQIPHFLTSMQKFSHRNYFQMRFSKPSKFNGMKMYLEYVYAYVYWPKSHYIDNSENFKNYQQIWDVLSHTQYDRNKCYLDLFVSIYGTWNFVTWACQNQKILTYLWASNFPNKVIDGFEVLWNPNEFKVLVRTHFLSITSIFE